MPGILFDFHNECDDDDFEILSETTLEIRRPLSGLPLKLNKIEEEDESKVTPIQSDFEDTLDDRYPHCVAQGNDGDQGRPKSANFTSGRTNVPTTRPRSSCAFYPSRIPLRVNSLRNNPTDDRSSKYEQYPERSVSACCMRTCSPEFFQSTRRSLKLLGFSAADLGLSESPREELPSRPHSTTVGPTFTTRLTRRTVSLDSLREIIKDAVMEGSADWSQRKLVAQATYEEWYFKKQKEAKLQRNMLLTQTSRIKETIKKEKELKMQRSKDEFEKWLKQKLEQKKKGSTNSGIDTIGKKDRVIPKVSKEISDRALLEWNKKKDKELAKQKRIVEKKREKEASDRKEKENKTLQSQKAYEEWKKKLIEEEKQKAIKKKKAKEELQAKITHREEGRVKSFQTWKEAKDKEIQQRLQHMTKAEREAKDALTMQLTEKRYEAEKAFEEWIQKVEQRDHKKQEKVRNGPPWTPV